MSQFKASDNHEVHLCNMSYTEIQNAKASALDDDDWDAYDVAAEAEKLWESQQ